MRTRKLLSPTQRRSKSSPTAVIPESKSFVLQPVPPHARRSKKGKGSTTSSPETQVQPLPPVTKSKPAASRFRERFSVAALPDTATLDKCHALIREEAIPAVPQLPVESMELGREEGETDGDDVWDGDTDVASSVAAEDLKPLLASHDTEASVARLSHDAGKAAVSRRQRPCSTGSVETYQSARHSIDSCDSLIDTVLVMPPLTPYSPGRAAEAHTPRYLAPTHLSLSSNPLSATLIHLGAARHTSLDPNSPTSPKPNTPLWAQRFQAQHQRRHEAHEAAEGNRCRLEAAEGMPRLFSRCDVPESPNGPLLAGSPQEQETEHWRPWKRPSEMYDWPAPRPFLDSVPRGAPRSGGSRYLSRLSRTLSSFLFGVENDGKGQVSAPVPVVPPIPPIPADLVDTATKRRVRGDGWGGLRAPSTWFKGYGLGPLVSPTPTPRKGLKSLYLPSLTRKKPPSPDDAWVDCSDDSFDSSTSKAPSTARSTSYCATSPIPLKRLRVRFASPPPTTMLTRQPPPSTTDPLLLRYKADSIECTTLSHERGLAASKLRRRGCFFLIVLVTLGTVVAVLAGNLKLQGRA